MRSVDGYGTGSISVIFITVWLWKMTQIIFWAAAVGGRRVSLLYNSIRIRLHVVIRVRSVIRSACSGDNFWGIVSYGSRSAPHFISSIFRSDCDLGWIRCCQITAIVIKYWLVIFTLPCSSIYIASCLMVLPGLVAIRAVWLVCLVWVGEVLFGVASFDEEFSSFWFQFCVPNKYCSVTPFQSTKNL